MQLHVDQGKQLSNIVKIVKFIKYVYVCIT